MATGVLSGYMYMSYIVLLCIEDAKDL
uniref:Uncharacterized protein n=1 Tax=Rhizophora mucronata TaxID=61149 RepID=A0A2P2R488_RHIMU